MRNRFRIGVAVGVMIAGIAGCREGRELARDDHDADATATGGGGAHGEAGGANGAGGAAMGSGGAPYPGTGGALDAGAPDHPSGTGGIAAGTGGARTGTGGMGVGGMGAPGTGGMGVGGTIAGTGGMGVGGTIAGTGGTPGTGGSPPNLLDVAQVLNGQMLLVPCLLDTAASVCATRVGACPAANADPTLSGAVTTDSTLLLAGTTGQAYTITLHVQGEVESKTYNGSLDANNVLASPIANGFATGGTPTPADSYEVFMLRVTNPGSATHTDYFLNSLAPPGVSNHTTYGIDYTAQIQAQGGATIRLVASDPNCSAIKNCGPMANAGDVCSAPIVLANVEPTAISMNPTISFTVPYNGEWIALTVKNVTSP